MAPAVKYSPSPLIEAFEDAQVGTVSFTSRDNEGKRKAVDQEGQTEEIHVDHGYSQARSVAVAEVSAASTASVDTNSRNRHEKHHQYVSYSCKKSSGETGLLYCCTGQT